MNESNPNWRAEIAAQIAAADALAAAADARAALWRSLPAAERAALGILRAGVLMLLNEGDNAAARLALQTWQAPAEIAPERAEQIRAALLATLPAEGA